MRDQYEPLGPTLEDGVTLGGGAVVIPEVTIGKGSFVAAGAIVTKNIPSNVVAYGSPAKEIRKNIINDIL